MRGKRDFSKFKQGINLSQYAASVGYEIDRKKSTRSSVAMRHPNGDKIIISRRGTNWVFFSVQDETDNGTIVDFIAKRTGKSIGEIGQELDGWLGGAVTPPEPGSFAREVSEQVYDRERVKRVFHYAKPISSHAYLEEARKISRTVLSDPRFAGRLFTDRYGNVVFPHHDHEGLCGLEIKNQDAGFLVRGSEKGLWTSRISKKDTGLVIAEGGIDALSYHDLFRPENTGYAAISGAMREKQFGLVMDLISRMENLEIIVLAVDHDEGGDRIGDKLQGAIESKGTFKGTIQKHTPERTGADWNDELKAIR